MDIWSWFVKLMYCHLSSQDSKVVASVVYFHKGLRDFNLSVSLDRDGLIVVHSYEFFSIGC